MYRHVALFRFQDGTTTAQIQAVADVLSGLPAVIPDIVDYRVGPDAGAVEGNWQLAVVADFAEPAHFDRYVAHPAHQAAIADHLRPILAQRAAVQFHC